jgi:D-3-phosphoglycerate dehydrogenase
VSLPEHAGKCRLLHIHHNVPGILAHINEYFSRAGINIAAQYLQTTAQVGYVVTDVDAAANRVTCDELAAVEGTIRCRVLY